MLEGGDAEIGTTIPLKMLSSGSVGCHIVVGDFYAIGDPSTSTPSPYPRFPVFKEGGTCGNVHEF